MVCGIGDDDFFSFFISLHRYHSGLPMGIIFEGKHVIRAPIQKVWDSMFDLDIIASCVPGCEKVGRIDEKTFESIVSARVGPVTARFQSTTTIVEKDPPRHQHHAHMHNSVWV